MILFNGKLLSEEKLNTVLEGMPDFCIQTIEKGKIRASEVLDACAALAEKIQEGVYDAVLKPLLAQGVFTERQLAEAVVFFQRENLEYKYQTELGCLIENGEYLDTARGSRIRRRYMPLGILLHIAAGNAEGLPFYSVIEGLLAGNINLLKLPSTDDGVSVFLLQELVKTEPKLAPYISVFDIPSTNLAFLKKLGSLADAIVVWGGDEAVRAARNLADPATQIISWGHKLSFAYLTPDAGEEELRALAAHICATNQLLCSSCQGLFVDTEDMAVVEEIGRRFLALLEEESRHVPGLPLGIRGKVSISLYNEELEASATARKVLRGKGVSVILAEDSTLELSYLFRNCWVKPLPRTQIVKALKHNRGYLQTAGLVCPQEDRAYLEEQLFKAGVVRVTGAAHMSEMRVGEAHDGMYPIRRYSRVVESI